MAKKKLKTNLKGKSKKEQFDKRQKSTETTSDKQKVKEKKIDKIKRSKEIDEIEIPKRESQYKKVNECALKIANKFPYNEIFDAHDSDLAPHIHGWLRDNYPNFQWLFDNGIMEVAAWYAKNKLEHKVDIIKIVDGVDLDKYECAKVELTEIHRLANYPNQPFMNVMVFAEEYLDNAVYWLEDSEWFLDDEEVRINLGRCSGELIAFTSWNIPVILITHLAFRNKGIYKAVLKADQIKTATVGLKVKLIHTYRKKVVSLEEKIDDAQRDAKTWHTMYSDLKKEYNLEYRKMLARIEYARTHAGLKGAININVVLVFGLIVSVILMVVGWMV